MKRKLTALLLAVLTLCLCTGAMAAGYPIDTQGKDVSLTVYCANAISNYVTDYNETPFFQEMEKATGIHINFIHPATSGMQEAMNLLFLGKELPDIIMCGNYYDGGVFQGLEDGYFVDLTDYLPEYAPDYWQLITSGDEIWRQVSNGDGRVAAFYTIKEPGDTQHRRMLLTQETLDEIGATIPTTLADVEDVFAKMLAHGITPYILDKTGYEPQFLGMYDLMKGFYKDAEGNILYGQVQPAFKDYLTLMHDWYEKGYISKDFIGSNTKNNQTLFDTGNGFYRRQLILTTKERPPDRVDDPDIAEKMCRELEGILLWAFEGLQRLVANHFRFTESVRARSNRETSKQDANNVLLFIEAGDYIRLTPEGKVGSQELYEIYTVWCRENGFSPLKNRSFSEFLIANQKKYSIEHSNNLTNLVGRRVWGFTGIEPVLKLPLRTSDGWQRDYSDDNPFI